MAKSLFQTALEARCHLALSRVLRLTNVERANEYEMLAWEGAYAIGSDQPDAVFPPAFFADEKILLGGWKAGQRDVETDVEYYDAYGTIVWLGDWNNDIDGLHETRAGVTKTRSGFMPGLEVSYQGGDCLPNYGAVLPTIEEAIVAATQMEWHWHTTIE